MLLSISAARLALTAVALASTLGAPAAAQLTLKVDAGPSSGGLPFPKIWENTGWCPPNFVMSAPEMHDFSVQEASWQNHAFIAAVPNQGLKYVRIHSMLNLVTIRTGASAAHPIPAASYNWTLLDGLLDMVAGDHKLRIGFEFMGNPRTNLTSHTGVYTSWKAPEQLHGWRGMVQALAQRYIARFGADAVSLWRFETWNEPDHNCNSKSKMKGGIDCDQDSWLGYWDACSDGLQAAAKVSGSAPLIFGGPGTGGNTATSWVLPALIKHLGAKFNATGDYGCSYLQWHNKGMLPGEVSYDARFPKGKLATTCNSYVDQGIMESVVAQDPAIARALPMGNEEVDMQGGWSKQLHWVRFISFSDCFPTGFRLFSE